MDATAILAGANIDTSIRLCDSSVKFGTLWDCRIASLNTGQGLYRRILTNSVDTLEQGLAIFEVETCFLPPTATDLDVVLLLACDIFCNHSTCHYLADAYNFNSEVSKPVKEQ